MSGLSRLSKNFQVCLETLQAVQKLSRLSGNFTVHFPWFCAKTFRLARLTCQPGFSSSEYYKWSPSGRFVPPLVSSGTGCLGRGVWEPLVHKLGHPQNQPDPWFSWKIISHKRFLGAGLKYVYIVSHVQYMFKQHMQQVEHVHCAFPEQLEITVGQN